MTPTVLRGPGIRPLDLQRKPLVASSATRYVNEAHHIETHIWNDANKGTYSLLSLPAVNRTSMVNSRRPRASSTTWLAVSPLEPREPLEVPSLA